MISASTAWPWWSCATNWSGPSTSRYPTKSSSTPRRRDSGRKLWWVLVVAHRRASSTHPESDQRNPHHRNIRVSTQCCAVWSRVRERAETRAPSERVGPRRPESRLAAQRAPCPTPSSRGRSSSPSPSESGYSQCCLFLWPSAETPAEHLPRSEEHTSELQS